MSGRVAAIDLGTNSCRLLVAERAVEGGLRTLDRRLQITRLGQGVDASGHLSEAAMDRVITAVTGYADVWRDAEVDTVGLIATSAARDAANGEVLMRRLQQVTGTPPRVLSGTEEAAMSFLGATAWLSDDHDAPVAVVDIGGGSTEVIIGSPGAGGPQRSTSRDIGSVRLTERVLVDDPPTTAQVQQARVVVDHELDAIRTAADPSSATTLIAVAGTATTLAAVHAGLDGWVDGAMHGTSLAAAHLSALADRLLSMTAAQIGSLGAVQPGREDVIAAGALILAMLVERFGFDTVSISEADVLDGLAMQLLEVDRG